MHKSSIEWFLVEFILFFLTLYIVAIIIFKQNYNTYTYYINGLFVIGYFIYLFLKKSFVFKINKIIYSYLLFVIFSLCSSIYGIDFSISSFKSLQLFILFVNLLLIYNIVINLNAEKAFLNGILLGSFLNYLLVLGILNAPFEIIMPGGGNRMMGTLGNPNVLSLVMLISIFVSIIYLSKKINKIFYYYQYVNIFLATYTIVLTASKKGAIFGFILITLFFIMHLKNLKKILNLLLLISAVIFIVFHYIGIEYFIPIIDTLTQRFDAFGTQMSYSDSSGSTGERKFLIDFGLSIFTDRPLYGHGIGSYYLLNPLGLYAHNNYIELLVGVGLIGMILFYAVYYFLYKQILKIDDKNLKILSLLLLFVFLFMDIAVVSYASKYLLYTIIFLSAYLYNLENKKENNNV